MKLTGRYSLGTSNANGHTYYKECFSKFAEGSNPISTHLMSENGVLGTDIAGYTHLHIDDESTVSYETILLDTDDGNMVKSLLLNGCKLYVVPNGLGRINDKGEIVEYSLISMNICTSSAFES